MPFLMGVHSPNLFMSTLRSSAMEEVVVVDLDRGTTTCSSLHSPRRNGDNSGSGGGSGLPWGRQLEAALALLHQTLRSPVEYESTPVIAALMQARPAPQDPPPSPMRISLTVCASCGCDYDCAAALHATVEPTGSLIHRWPA